MKQVASTDQPLSTLYIKAFSPSQPRSRQRMQKYLSPLFSIHHPTPTLSFWLNQQKTNHKQPSPVHPLLESLSVMLFQGTVAFMQVLNPTIILIYLL